MALSDVLSTLRVVLLDDFSSVPAERAERELYFRNKFPKLSEDEIQDFAAITPKQFELYTGTIFSGQRSVLRKHFPISFFLIEKHWASVSSEPFSAYKLTRSIHKSHPWKGNTTAALIESLIAFISEDNPELVSKVPAILDTLKLEQISLELRRTEQEDEPPPENWSSLSQLNIADFLCLEFSLSQPLRFVDFEYNVLPLYREFFRLSGPDLAVAEKLSDISKEHVYAIGSRRYDLAVRWLSVSPATFAVLQEEIDDLNSLAEAVIDELVGSNDEERFKSFVDLVQRLIVNEVISIAG